MRAMRAEEFKGYKELKLVALPKPAVEDGKVLLRMTAVGFRPMRRSTPKTTCAAWSANTSSKLASTSRSRGSSAKSPEHWWTPLSKLAPTLRLQAETSTS